MPSVRSARSLVRFTTSGARRAGHRGDANTRLRTCAWAWLQLVALCLLTACGGGGGGDGGGVGGGGYFQYVVIDPNGPFLGLGTLSNGLAARLGN